jgi:hypothetical protein
VPKSGALSALAKHQGVQDGHATIDVNVNVKTGNGSTSLHQTQTTLKMPRGSGMPSTATIFV